MTGPGYRVSPSALDAAAAGIEAVLDGLRALAPIGVAEQGRGVDTLAPLPGDVGHVGLTSAFVAFCNRWEWGVRAAVRNGREVAGGLRAAGGSYGRADSMGRDLLARAALDIGGDPGANPEDATWADVEAAARPDPRLPDWDRVGRQWVAVGRDLVEGSGPGLIVRALQGADVHGDLLDDVAPIAE